MLSCSGLRRCELQRPAWEGSKVSGNLEHVVTAHSQLHSVLASTVFALRVGEKTMRRSMTRSVTGRSSTTDPQHVANTSAVVAEAPERQEKERERWIRGRDREDVR